MQRDITTCTLVNHPSPFSLAGGIERRAKRKENGRKRKKGREKDIGEGR
jgi:hypothetical protein